MAKSTADPAADNTAGPAPPLHTEDLYEWTRHEYTKGVGIAGLEGGTPYRRLLGSFPALQMSNPNGDPMPLSGLLRTSRLLELKMNYTLPPTGCVCMVARARYSGKEVPYAFAYWPRSAEGAPPEYVCYSPTYESRDGEYRTVFIRYGAFATACEALADQLAPFEAFAAKASVELVADVYPTSEIESITRVPGVDRLPVTLFAVALMVNLRRGRAGGWMPHTSPAYLDLLGAIAHDDAALEEESAAVHRAAKDSGPYMILWQGREGSNDLKCGQKVVPMFTREVLQPADASLGVWRELLVMQAASDLVLNAIAPGFPIYNQWAYLERVGPGLFGNPAMADRYRRGAAASAAVSAIREARRGLRGEGGYHVAELDAHLYESLEYAQSFLEMSDTAMLHTMEDVGVTLYSAPQFIRRAEAHWPPLLEAFASSESCAHYIFDYAYAAHCLHAKLGVAHTDLHSNNMTLYTWGFAGMNARAKTSADKKGYEPYYADPLAAYVIGGRGEADTFLFPAAGISGCLIDFSRAILGPGFRPRLEAGRGPRHATNFYRDQVNRAMRALHRYAPAYVAEHQAVLKAVAIANFEALFPVLCAVDFVAIGASVGAVFLEAREARDPLERRPFAVSAAGPVLARRLEEAGREALITGLQDLVHGGSGLRPPPFPGDAILRRVFGEWAAGAWAARSPARLGAARLVDAYNFAAPLRWSGGDYARYPPWARIEQVAAHLGELRAEDVFEGQVEPFLAAMKARPRAGVIAAHLQEEQRRLDGEPVATASSWIDE